MPYLLDSWDLARREVGGYSKAIRSGPWSLGDLLHCPSCGCPVWPRSLRAPFSVRFSGGRVGDVAFGFAATLIVSETCIGLFRRHDLLGALFSPSPISWKAKKGAVIEAVPPRYYACFPEPEFACLAPAARAEIASPISCTTCCTAEVLSLRAVAFDSTHDLPDLFMPSSLPGWFAVSDRAAKLISSSGLTNFRFVTAFRRSEGRQLIREYGDPLK